jgi:Zn-finger nucleic acid-binding protein
MTIALCKIFRIPLCQRNELRSVVGENRGKFRKGDGRNERKQDRKEERKKDGKKERKEEIKKEKKEEYIY